MALFIISVVNSFNSIATSDLTEGEFVIGDKKSYATNQVKQLFKKLNLKKNQDSIYFVMNTIN